MNRRSFASINGVARVRWVRSGVGVSEDEPLGGHFRILWPLFVTAIDWFGKSFRRLASFVVSLIGKRAIDLGSCRSFFLLPLNRDDCGKSVQKMLKECWKLMNQKGVCPYSCQFEIFGRDAKNWTTRCGFVGLACEFSLQECLISLCLGNECE